MTTNKNSIFSLRIAVLSLSIVASVVMLLLLPLSAQAAPCAGTTITPMAQGNAFTCENGISVRNITGLLGNGFGEATVRLTGAGSGPVVVNILGGSGSGSLFGGVNFSGSSGNITVNNTLGSGAWSFRGDIVKFGGGDDSINNAGTMLTVTSGNVRSLDPSSIDFGAGQDLFSNAGTLVVGATPFSILRINYGPDSFLGPYNIFPAYKGVSTTTFNNLETFRNTGLLVLGGMYSDGTTSGPPSLVNRRFFSSDAAGEAHCRSVLKGNGVPSDPPEGYLCTDASVLDDTNRISGDVLSIVNTTFIGEGDSAILLDAMFGEGVAQSHCQQRTGGAEVFHRLPGADCIDIRGGATEGSTQVIVRDARLTDQGSPNPNGIVIVDVNGGTSAAEHFTLSPKSDHYRETANGRGFIDKGLFAFPLIYDESTQQHKLIGIQGAGALQLPLLTHAAQSVARQVTSSGLDERNQNIRTALRNGKAAGGGFWGEFGEGALERDLVQSTTAAGETFAFNNDYDQDSSTMILGGDWLMPSGDKTAWLVGGSIGYVRSEVDFAASGNNADLEGVALGLHGGYLTGHWFLNAGYSQGFLQVDDYVPTFNLSTDGSGADTQAQTQSVKIDGGRRFSITDALYVEPLVTFAWIRADFDDLIIASPDNPLATSNRAKFGNAVSLRGALGARIGFEMPLSSLRIHYGLTGRYWNEFDGETKVTIASTGPDAALADTFDGSFLDLAGRIGISDGTGNVSGYIDARSTSGDDYSSLGLSAGFRYQW